MSRPKISLWPALPKSVIRPEIYGHFAEHLGRCIYEGVWVGEEARLPNENGLRLDVLAALKHLRAPVVRWPGGCFADDYHWRDGVGPRGERPATANVWWRQGEPNEFGTNEFMRFCRALGCQPYLCANVGSGSPREARDWVEYCNFGGDSSLSAARGRDGSPEPHGVKYWGVGNENWGCGGRFSGGDYAKEFARYGTYMKAMDPSIELVACGASVGDRRNPMQNDWNHEFCAGMKHPDLVDHIALHRHFSRGSGKDFSDSDFRGLFADVFMLERDLKLTEALLSYHYPDKLVGIMVDEWGMWHPEAQIENGLEQDHTLRDALLAASVLNLFNRWSHRVTMANIAQTVNVLQCLAMTQGNRMFLTPTYYAFEMMRPHMGARLITHETDSPSYFANASGGSGPKYSFEGLAPTDRGTFQSPIETGAPTDRGTFQSPFEGGRPEGPGDVVFSVPLLDASVSMAGKKVLVTVVNRSLDADLETVIQLREARAASVSAKVMSAADPRAANSFAVPSGVASKRAKVEAVEGGTIVHVFPRHSLTSLTITLE
jgi:alpha-N-arabinofuranosidase